MVARIFVRFFSRNITKCSSENAVGGKNIVDVITVTGDGKTIVAWHPDITFPYQFSRPIPDTVSNDFGSLLKENSLTTAMRAFKQKYPEVARQELMNLTHTTKHRWFPRSRDKRAKNTQMDRPYL